jgi:AraC family transcriptional regulator
MQIPFDYSQDRSNIPLYATEDQLDELSQLILGAQRGENYTISSHRRDRPGFGTTAPTPVVAGYVAIIQLRPGGTYDLLCDARHVARTELRTGYTKVLDLRNLWVADLKNPFHSFSFVVPQSMFDEITTDLKQSRIEEFRCHAAASVCDPVMLNLAKAIYPAFERPGAINALASAHLFQAACLHLAQSYGGLKAEPASVVSGLAKWQERRVKELMADNLQGNVSLNELSDACELSQFRLANAFKNTVGVAPHQWLMERRIDSAKSLLACTGQDIPEIAKFCGFRNAAHLRRVFSKVYAMTPERWRNMRRN